jgi:endonuclease YncB( thermonuclease family)
MRLRLVLASLALLAAAPAEARHRGHRRAPPAAVLLDGARVAVRWTDGDTFRILDGAHAGRAARLDAYNTLETFGPVHRWGGWSGEELLALAKAAGPAAARSPWRCTTAGAEDRYHRLLVACPEAAAELVAGGLAMVYAVDRPAEPRLLALQRKAQRQRLGMWAKGVPPEIPTSLHAVGENGGGATYDRVVDTRTGAALKRAHGHAYRTCQEVCVGGGADRACMVYVPFERRYRHRPSCLARLR